MKNIKFLLACLLVFLLALFIFGGCGGGSSSSDTASEPEQPAQADTQEDAALDAAITRITEKVLALDENGVPAVFNHAPLPDTYGAEDDFGLSDESVNFKKIITNNDLDENYEFVQTLGLQKGCGYIVKYSHSGRDLNFSTLSLRITTPDNKDMILNLSGNTMSDKVTNESYPVTVKSINDLSSSEITRILNETGMTRAELAAEIANDNSSAGTKNVIYVDATLEVIPEENPCEVLYTFKAPVTGSYKFAFGETNSGGLPAPLETPLEVRVYTSIGSFSAGDDESFDLTSRNIIDIQRMLINSATEFNEYGQPVKWDNESSDTEDPSVNASFLVLPQTFKPIIGVMISGFTRLADINDPGYEVDRPVTLKDRIDDIPYDDVYEPCAGFYALNGLRAIIDSAFRDDQYSENAIEFYGGVENINTPANSGSLSLTQKFNVDLIGTEEEHDRAVGLNDMTNFALIGYATGTYGNNDPVDLGVVNTKNVHLRYELIEDSMRWCRNEFKFRTAALNMLKNNRNAFQRNFGDYYVCGYTWGLFYDALIEIRAKTDEGYAVQACSKAADEVRTMLRYANDSRNRSKITSLLNQINNNYSRYVTISVKQASYSGKSNSSVPLTLNDFVNEVMNFISGARSKPKSDYHRLYVSLRNYYDVEPADQYMERETDLVSGPYNDVRVLTKKIYHTRCYYNALSAIPDSDLLYQGADFNLSKGLKSKLKEFDSLLSEMMFNMNAISKNGIKIHYYYDKFDSLYKWYKDYAERYGFYKYFVAVQQNTSTRGWSDSDEDYNEYRSYGFYNYDKSQLVQMDFENITYRFYHEEPWNSGPGYADFNVTLDNVILGGNRRIAWFDTGTIKTNHSRAEDRRSRTIGTNGINWYYKCASSRRMEVYLNYRVINMPQIVYPFAGLQN